MDTVLGDLNWEAAACYIDDVIVFSDSVEDHHRHLGQLAARLQEFGMVVKASKCVFYTTRLQYLGYWLDGKSVMVLPERVAAILRCSVPTDRQELRAFLGLTGQFRHLIHKYAELAAPLEAMKHQSSKTAFNIGEGTEAVHSFHSLKKALEEMPDLVIPDFNLPFHAYTDASDVAMSMVLCQMQEGIEHVVSFFSKGFKGSQLAWSTPTKEAYALRHFCMGKAWAYLASRGPHIIYVDSLSSRALTRSSLQNVKLLRCALELQELNLEIRLVSGLKNKSDALTRAPFVKTSAALQELLGKNPLRELKGWQEAVKHDDALEASATVGVIEPPESMTDQIVELKGQQDKDEEIQAMVQFITAGRPGPASKGDSFASAALEFSRATRWLVITKGGLLMRIRSLRGKLRTQVVVPKKRREQLLLQAHEGSKDTIHGGRNGVAMSQELQDSVWWRRMKDDCIAFTCAICDRQKKGHVKPAGVLHTTIAERPGEVLSMDLVKLPKADGFIGCAILVDKFSGFMAAVPMEKMDTQSAIRAFDSSLGALFVDVRRMRVDCDTVFTSKAFEAAMKARGIELEVAFADHQQANFAERTIQQVKQVLRTTLDGLPTHLWPSVVRDVAKYLNCVQSSAKGASPVEICTGWLPKGYLPFSELEGKQVLGQVFDDRLELWERVRGNMEIADKEARLQYEKGHEDRRFVVGDVVRLKMLREDRERSKDDAGGAAKTKSFNLSSPWDQNPWIVEVALSEISVRIRSFERDVKSQEVHVNRLKLAVLEPNEVPRESGEYVVQKIHSHVQVSPGKYDYLVEWGGYRDVRWHTWEHEEDLLVNAGELVARYKKLAFWNKDEKAIRVKKVCKHRCKDRSKCKHKCCKGPV